MAEAKACDDLNRLLIMDDEPEMRDFFRDVSTGLGYVTAEAGDKAEFDSAYDRLQPNVIILDLTMPEIDGVEILRDLAQRGSSARVILASGQDERILNTALRLGRMLGLSMQSALQKPVNLPDLEEALEASKNHLLPVTPERIERAVQAGELTVHYQAKVLLQEVGFPVCGAEALVRWNHPTRGLLSPHEFIPIAEDHGLIGMITESMTHQAIKQLASWGKRGLYVPISVNVSPCQLIDLTLPDRVERKLRDAGVDASLLTLEITEQSAMADVQAATDILTRLRLKNIDVALDDFGAGYSSLAEVYRMPLSELKVDRSLIVDLDHDAHARGVMAGVAALAKELKLPLCVEGIETLKTAELLRSLGCSKGQGFLFTRTLEAERFYEVATASPMRGDKIEDRRRSA